ncbi:HNH endonuclease family protein [Streptomyces sp. URMC 123]|uniref:HNH endonuclease family protein n=1 Tax=Streptomyces sp. URMC 123 TaxID=3423403 RepID=UPI003F1BF6B3
MPRGALSVRGAAAVAAALAVLLGGCSSDGGDGPDDGKRGTPGSALAAARELTVKGRAPKTGYERERFGTPWADTDGNGCRTRDDILKRDLADVAFTDGTSGRNRKSGKGARSGRSGEAGEAGEAASQECQVASGTLKNDPYTGKDVPFTRGSGSSVDIDHVVALSDAWQKGASQWEPSKRIALANDPLNLLAVDASTNREKGDGDTATWLPPNKGYRCEYVARQVAVKRKYELWVTDAERDAMVTVLSDCPSQPLPTGGTSTSAPTRFTAR